jgi:hypothetical protein
MLGPACVGELSYRIMLTERPCYNPTTQSFVRPDGLQAGFEPIA